MTTPRLIDLDNGQKILIDYANMRDANNDEDLRIDLPAKLRDDLKAAKRDDYDVVAFTHVDNDHILGFSEFFYLNHAQKYQDDKRIKINELWIPAAVILEENLTGEKRVLRTEARHRLKEGKGIRVFSKPDKLENWLKEQDLTLDDRKHLITNAGQLIPGFRKSSEGVEFFVHSPFSETVDGKNINRNDAALVLQATFEYMEQETKLVMGADIAYEVWSDIVNITKYYHREERLEWDIFKISHHCSYKALSDEKGKNKTKPVPEIEWLFEQGNQGGILVSTSDPIPTDDSTQPPHRQAANFYKDVVKGISGVSFRPIMYQQFSPRMCWEFSPTMYQQFSPTMYQ